MQDKVGNNVVDDKKPVEYNSDHSETETMINALKSLIMVLNLLDLEIAESIRKKEVFKKCLIKVGKWWLKKITVLELLTLN